MRNLLCGIITGVSLLVAGCAVAQSSAVPSQMGYTTNSGCTPGVTYCFKQYGPIIPISGTFTAAAFTPTSATSNATIGVTNSSTPTALPVGVTQVVTNSGSKTAYVTFSTGAGAATTGGYPITANSTVAFTPGASTFINAITGGTDTTTLVVSGGAGEFQGAGGGSSSGGGGGAVTVADGADVAEGATTVTTACATAITSPCTNAQILRGLLLQSQSTTPVNTNAQQINGVILLTGNGVTGTGSQRVTIASDNTAFSVNAAITGTLPAFAATPTFNIGQGTLGTTNGVAIKDVNNVAPDFTTTAPTGVMITPGKNVAGVFTQAVSETCSSGNVANATVACTLATTSGKTTYISGFSMTADGAAVGLAAACTLTGTITGTMNFTFSYPAGVAVAGQPLIVQFNTPIPASTTNTTIVASCPASGTGGTNAAMTAWGLLL